MIAELERRKALQFEDEAETMSNLEYVARWVEGGKTILRLANDIIYGCAIDLSPSALSNYLYNTWPDEAPMRLAKARKIASHAWIEDAAEIVDDASTMDREVLKKAEMQANLRVRRAEAYNRDEIGGGPASVNIQVNLGSLHLRAMEAIQASRPVARIASSSVGAVEVEQLPA